MKQDVDLGEVAVSSVWLNCCLIHYYEFYFCDSIHKPSYP